MDPRPLYQVLENVGINHAIDGDTFLAPLALARARHRGRLAVAQASNQFVTGTDSEPRGFSLPSFPFTDQTGTQKRPAVIVGNAAYKYGAVLC